VFPAARIGDTATHDGLAPSGVIMPPMSPPTAPPVIKDEHLSLRWGVSVGGEGVGGYTVYDFDRLEYLLNEQAQEFSFTNELWHAQVRDLFKTIAERHEAGEF
jgi:hypothetical protein